jgi:hypothetical protein
MRYGYAEVYDEEAPQDNATQLQPISSATSAFGDISLRSAPSVPSSSSTSESEKNKKGLYDNERERNIKEASTQAKIMNEYVLKRESSLSPSVSFSPLSPHPPFFSLSLCNVQIGLFCTLRRRRRYS